MQDSVLILKRMCSICSVNRHLGTSLGYELILQVSSDACTSPDIIYNHTMYVRFAASEHSNYNTVYIVYITMKRLQCTYDLQPQNIRNYSTVKYLCSQFLINQQCDMRDIYMSYFLNRPALIKFYSPLFLILFLYRNLSK